MGLFETQAELLASSRNTYFLLRVTTERQTLVIYLDGSTVLCRVLCAPMYNMHPCF